MILLDASVVISYLRSRERRLGLELVELDLGICGVTRAEVLHGVRSDDERSKVLEILDQFQQVKIADKVWDRVGDRLRELRSKGVIVPFPDAVVATLAIELNFEVWAHDSHFPLMAGVLPLRLYGGIK